MPKIAEVKPGPGWTLSNRLETDEVFLFGGGTSCQYVDPSTNRLSAVHLDPVPQHVDPVNVAHEAEILYVGSGPVPASNPSSAKSGIWSYAAGRPSSEALHVDLLTHTIENLWTSHRDPSRVLFLRSTNVPDRRELISGEPTVRSIEAKDWSIHEWRRSGAATTVAAFQKPLYHASIDRESDTIFGTLYNKVICIEIPSGNYREVCLNRWGHLVSSNRGTIIASPANPAAGGSIDEVTAEGRASPLVPFGLLPSPSTDGTMLAFMKTGGEPWLRRPDGTLDQIALGAAHGPLWDTPKWCLCGRHLAVRLGRSRSADQGTLVLADVASKTLIVTRGSSICSYQVSAWVPGSVMNGTRTKP